jgi:hypothetical protein
VAAIAASYAPGLLLTPLFVILYGVSPLSVPAILSFFAGVNILWGGLTLGLDRSFERPCSAVAAGLVFFAVPNVSLTPPVFLSLAALFTFAGLMAMYILLDTDHVYHKSWEPDPTR